MDSTLVQACEKFTQWFQRDALPLWASVGIDPQTGANFEKLLADGSPDKECNIRVRVQARQIFVYAFAHHLGWFEGAQKTAEGIMHFMESSTRHPTATAGYTHLMDASFKVIDQKQDLYDHAFFLLSHCWYYRAFQSSASLEQADRIIDHLDREFGSDVGGWTEGDYPHTLRRQNPHMHLFEAFLALYDATKDPKYLQKADQIYTLFCTKFYDADHHVLLEFFNEDWSLAEGDKGRTIEPGHMMEWVWLLRWYATLCGKNVDQYADALYDKAMTMGFAKSSGLMYDETLIDGQLLGATKRSWPMTEVIKANIAQARAGNKACEGRAAAAIETLFTYYLTADIAGTYCDQRGANDEVLMESAPASTLYHLIVAAAEVHAYVHADKS